MGNREALLRGARQCIVERGYANTTARDIASAAGVSLAAIGYHFGSKEQLLTEALVGLMGNELGDALEARMRAAASRKSTAAMFEATWDGLGEVFAKHRAQVLASLENLPVAARADELRQLMGGAVGAAIGGFSRTLEEVRPELGKTRTRAVAELYFALLNGLAVQWILDPEHLPRGAELRRAIEALAGS